jgi:DNA modification methylase
VGRSLVVLQRMSNLFFGDNLRVLQEHVQTNSIDLVYLDPPFNSKAQYNLLYETPDNRRETAQRSVFRDTWSWEEEAEFCFETVLAHGGNVASIVNALVTALKRSDTAAYLAMMAARLVEIRRVLKQRGSLYLHCDPTASHYLKLVLDQLFEPSNYRNEISWRRTSAHNDAKQGRRQYGNVRDVILFYTASDDWCWNQQYTPYEEEYLTNEYKHESDEGLYKETDVTAAKPGGDTSYVWRIKRREGSKERWQPDLDSEYLLPKSGWEYKGVRPYEGRFWAYSQENLRRFWDRGELVHRSTGMPRLVQFADKMPGVPLQNDWQDIRPAPKSEALGYPTQKPLSLMRRIIQTSSNRDDIVLDPFCGCGTTIHAAAELGRQWIGVDVSYYAIRLIERRLRANFGDTFLVPISGIPADLASAEALADRDPYGFQQWVVGELGCQLWNDGKKGPDTGIDGEMWFFNGPGNTGRLLAQVKGGRTTGAPKVREFRAVLEREKAHMGIFFCRTEPTSEMRREAASCGIHRIGSSTYSRLQLFSLSAWFAGQRPNVPVAIELHVPRDKSSPYRRKRLKRPDPKQPQFAFAVEGGISKPRVGQVINPAVLPPEALRSDGIG